MPTFYHNPENALKRANEFIELGRSEEAMECLYDVLKNRKNRVYKIVHEAIVSKFLELCVEHRRCQTAKDGLYIFRTICQGVNTRAWEYVVLKYLQLAEQKVETAREKAHLAILDADYLDQALTPESLLKCVSCEDAQDRTERIVLVPWIKFLWECYRTCLELLRNTQTDKLYHKIAQKAFRFCVKYSRKSELRKLCSILRLHLGYMQKGQIQLLMNMNDPEIQCLYLETGITELDSAVNLELWQDAFKAIEDIHVFINVSKKLHHSRIMANYYEKLSLVFWKAKDLLFHAAALLRYFILSRDQKKNLTTEEVAKMASRVVLATLSIPFPFNNPVLNYLAETDESVADKKQRLLATLLDLPSRPTRKLLIKDLERLGIIQCVPSEFQNLFRIFELKTEPLKLGSEVLAAIDFIDKWAHQCDLKMYIQPLCEISVIRLLLQFSQIYKTITFEKLIFLLPINDVYTMETLIADAARRYEIPLRIDHVRQCVHFISDLDLFRNEQLLYGAKVSQLPMDRHQKLLNIIYVSLQNIANCIKPEAEKIKSMLITTKLAKRYMISCVLDHKAILERKKIIEKQKEMIENLRLKKEEEEKQRLVAKQLKYEAAEKERLLREAEERNMQRLRQQQEELRKKILLEKMENLRKTQMGCQLVENLEVNELESLDPEILLSKQIEQFNRERKEFLSKLRRQERKFDYLERAKRVEEIPLLKLEHAECSVKDQQFWEQNERTKFQNAVEEHARIMHNKKRAIKIKNDLDKFIDRMKEKWDSNYRKKMSEFLRTLQSERRKRLKDRAMKRKSQRRLKWKEEHKDKLRQRKEYRNRKTYDTKEYYETHNVNENEMDQRSLKEMEVGNKDSGSNIEPFLLEKNTETKYSQNTGISKVSLAPDKETNMFPCSRTTSNISTMSQPYYSSKQYENKESKYRRSQVLRRTEVNHRDRISRDSDYSESHDKRWDNMSRDSSLDAEVKSYGYGKRVDRGNWRTSAAKEGPFDKIKYYDSGYSWRQRDKDTTTKGTYSVLRRTADIDSEYSYKHSTAVQPASAQNHDYMSSSSEKPKFNLKHSCTPWAKSSRKEDKTE